MNSVSMAGGLSYLLMPHMAPELSPVLSCCSLLQDLSGGSGTGCVHAGMCPRIKDVGWQFRGVFAAAGKVSYENEN